MQMYATKSLDIACSRGYDKVVSLLLDKGHGNVNRRNSDGHTPLFTACDRGHVHIVTLLLDKGANVNSGDNNDETPLYEACYHGCDDIVAVLIDKGHADVSSVNKYGNTPLLVACSIGTC